MTIFSNSCETGLTTGTTVTNGNNATGGAGDAFSVSKGAGSTLAYSSIWAAHGSLSYRFQGASGASESNFVQWTVNTGQCGFRFYYRPDSGTPSSSELIFQARNSAGQALQLQHNTDGVLRMQNATSGNATTGWTTALASNTTYRVEGVIEAGSSTTTGRFNIKVFAGDGTTAIVEYNWTGMNAGGASGNFTTIRFGRAGAVNSTFGYYMDDFYAVTESTAFPGPVGANTPPSADAGSPQSVVAGSLVTLSGTDSDPDGTIASRAWAQVGTWPATVTLSGSTTQTPTFTPTVSGTYTFQYTVTDDDGASTSDTVAVRVRTNTARTESVASNAGGWAVVGAADIVTALNDSSDTSYIETADDPNEAAIVLNITPMTAGIPTVTGRVRANNLTSASTIEISLYVDGVLVTGATGSTTLTGSWVDFDITGTASVAADAVLTVELIGDIV